LRRRGRASLRLGRRISSFGEVEGVIGGRVGEVVVEAGHVLDDREREAAKMSRMVKVLRKLLMLQ
jgi:hypothetical protein